MKKIIVLFLILSSLGDAFAQPEDAKIETIDGKQYYVHYVEQGNTLYGIQTLYKTDMQTILQANPNLTDNLTIGQRILIPVKGQSSVQNSTTHKVNQGETLYGISKKYGCTVEEIIALNPGVENGLSIGYELKIPSKNVQQNTETIQKDPEVSNQPKYEISYTDSLVRHTVLEHETLYSISKRYMVTTDTIQKLNNLTGVKVKKGDVLLIPVKNVDYQIIEKQIVNPDTSNIVSSSNVGFVREDVYTVALLLPFMLNQNDAEMAKPLKIDQVREMYPLTKMNFEFYQGFVFAADSLQSAGLSVEIYVYDTKKDSATIAEIFSKPEFEKVDLVVGPMYQSEVNVVSKFCAERSLPFVLPFKVEASVMYNNPYVYKTVASNMTLFDGAVDYIIQNHAQHNVLIVKPVTTSDLAIYDRVRERYNKQIASVPNAMNNHIVEVSQGSNSGKDIQAYIKTDTVNIVLVPSENIKFVAGVMTRLNSVLNNSYRSKNLKIIIFGIEDWNRYQDLDMSQRNKLNQHYATYRFVDYNSGKGLEFVKAYRKRYGTDPTIFSAQGFDIGLYFMGALHLYGKNFDPYLANYEIELIQNDFKFETVADGSGKENIKVAVVAYNNYSLIKLTE